MAILWPPGRQLREDQPVRLPRTLAPRQGPVITQTIIRPSTTFITYVTLGPAPPEAFEPQPTTASTTQEQPEPTSTRPATIYGSDGALSSAEIGAILGSVVAFVAIILIIWHCIAGDKQPVVYDSSDDESSAYFEGSSSGSSDSSSTPRDPWNEDHSRSRSRGRPPPPRPPPPAAAAPRPAPRGPPPMVINTHPRVQPAYSNVRRIVR